MTQRTLLSTDKNGTKLFGVRTTCGKCGGRGIIGCYVHVNGGECFDCFGSGIVEYTEKEYTPEYAAKLEERRAKAHEKKVAKAKAEAAEKNLQFFEKNGFNAEGKCWVVLGNTYPIKDELKEKGARYLSIGSKWYFNNPVEGYELLEMEADDFYFADFAGAYSWKNWRSFEDGKLEEALKRIEEASTALIKKNDTTEFFGEVGKRVELQLTLERVTSFQGFSYSYYDSGITFLHTFKDAEGHVFIWKTGSPIEAEEGSAVSLKGTIKEHSEYKGTKQTVLTRCKVL